MREERGGELAQAEGIDGGLGVGGIGAQPGLFLNVVLGQPVDQVDVVADQLAVGAQRLFRKGT